MTRLRCRIFYVLALLCATILLLPYPGTVFLAFCYSCLSLPFYRRLKYYALRQSLHMPEKPQLKNRIFRIRPILFYSLSIVATILVPIFAFVIVVAPQANLGIVQLRNMDLAEKLKILMPENINNFITAHLPSLKDYPQLENIVNELSVNIESFFSTGGDLFNPTFLWQRTVALLGGTMSVLWLLCLFIILTILFSSYAKEAKIITRRILDMGLAQQNRFITSIRRALRAVILGIVFVALLQGFFCAVGFAFAGIESPAFWGLLAAFVAPIPMVGTMLVWGPLAILLWFKGSHIAAVGLALWGTLVISNIDSFCRPVFLQQGIPAPYFVLILVMICGLNVFGPIGLIAAPLLLAFALTLLKEGRRAFIESVMTEKSLKEEIIRERK